MMKKYFFLLVTAFLLITNCSKTYEDYNVAIDISNSVIIDNKAWDLEKFVIIKEQNTAQGDTADFEYFRIEVYDKSYPYPKQLTGNFYINSQSEKMELSTEFSDDGVIERFVLNEIDIMYENVLYHFIINKEKVFPPTMSIHEYDHERKLISGTVEGALYDINKPDVKRNIKISFQNIRIR